MPNGLATLQILLGTLWSGRCVNPVNPLDPQQRKIGSVGRSSGRRRIFLLQQSHQRTHRGEAPNEATEAELQAHCKAKLGRYKSPTLCKRITARAFWESTAAKVIEWFVGTSDSEGSNGHNRQHGRDKFYAKGAQRSNLVYTLSSFSAGIAQLVERNLAKVEVASSNLVSRSKFEGKVTLK